MKFLATIRYNKQVIQRIVFSDTEEMTKEIIKSIRAFSAFKDEEISVTYSNTELNEYLMIGTIIYSWSKLKGGGMPKIETPIIVLALSIESAKKIAQKYALDYIKNNDCEDFEFALFQVPMSGFSLNSII